MYKKIGILTYFWTDNPGTFLQAYSIQEAYRRVLVDDRVEVINYQSFRWRWRPNFSHMTVGQWKRDLTRHAKYNWCRRHRLNLTPRRLVCEDPAKAWRFLSAFRYDLISVGSDTLLELWRTKADGVTAYWLNPEIPARKVMCAASARATQFTDLCDGQKDYMRTSVRDFDLLGVRDAATYELLRCLGVNGEKLRVVPDPTFAYEIDPSHADAYFHKRGITFDRPTVALHLLRQMSWAGELASSFRAMGWQVLSLRPAAYADYVVNDISPFEWAGLFGACDLVITHRFHDTVFSLKNKKPTVVLVPNRDRVTTSGDSKYHTCKRLFDFDNVQLIEDWTRVSADEVLEKGLLAFRNHRPEPMETKLQALKEAFQSYIKRVADLLN